MWKYRKTKRKNVDGFLTTELLIGVILSSIVLGSFMMTMTSFIRMEEAVKGILDGLYDGRFARRVITNQIRFTSSNVTVDSGGSKLTISESPLFKIRFYSGQFRKELSDGQLQPLTGSAVDNEKSRYGIGTQGPIFVITNNDNVRTIFYVKDLNTYTGRQKEVPIYNANFSVLPLYDYLKGKGEK